MTSLLNKHLDIYKQLNQIKSTLSKIFTEQAEIRESLLNISQIPWPFTPTAHSLSSIEKRLLSIERIVTQNSFQPVRDSHAPTDTDLQHCSKCDFTCKNKNDMKEHNYNMHGNKCNLCDFTLWNDEHMKKHMQVRHPTNNGIHNNKNANKLPNLDLALNVILSSMIVYTEGNI